MTAITVEMINLRRKQYGHMSPFLRVSDVPGVKSQPRVVTELEEWIKEFEASPKRRGNRDHFRNLLSIHLTDAQASHFAYGTWE